MLARLWEIAELNFQPDQLQHSETLFTIGNGYLSTRGAFDERYAGDAPSTLVHGIYDHAPNVLVPELVNAPNWLELNLTIDGTPFQMVMKTTDYLKPPQGVVLGYRRTLDLKRAVLRREVLFRATSGSVVRLVFERFASLADEHVLVQRLEITSVDGNPTIEIESALDGDVTNNGAVHFKSDMMVKAEGNRIGLEGTTPQSGYVVAVASLLTGGTGTQSQASSVRPTTKTTVQLQQEGSATVEKFTSFYTSRDLDGSPLDAALAKVQEASQSGYDALFQAHEREWAIYWDTADIRIDSDEEIQRALRFTTYHILIAAPRNDDRVSIGAKTLSGLGYKGHVFWDTELFIVPVLTLVQPKLARNLLMYRYHNLQGARNKAKANGYEGAMFPWESTDTGEETTPSWGDPQPDGTRIRIWTGDREQHISTDIAYAVWHHWQWTGDDEFMRKHGAEIILDTAVFWGSRVEAKNGRYELSEQIGPDEYHEGIDNSVFTNRMVVWHLATALQLLDILKQRFPHDAERLTQALGLTEGRQAHWRDVIEKMYIPFDEEKQIHIQFPGFFEMEYIPVPHYQPRTTSVQAILGHYRSIQTQVIKQADVVMLMALLGDAVGSPEVLMNNWNTYFPRTDHGSSLSPAMHAWVAARLGLMDDAYELLHHGTHIDLDDNKGNVRDGMHAAACGGVWQATVFGFCGLKLDGQGGLTTDPHLPDHWKTVQLRVYYQGEKRDITVTNPDSSAGHSMLNAAGSNDRLSATLVGGI